MGTPNSHKDGKPEVQLTKDLFSQLKPVFDNISGPFRVRYRPEDDFSRYDVRLLELLCKAVDGKRVFVDKEGAWWLSSLDDDSDTPTHVTLTQIHPPEINLSYDNMLEGVHGLFGKKISKRKRDLKSLESRDEAVRNRRAQRREFLRQSTRVESIRMDTLKPGQIVTALCTDNKGTFVYSFEVLGTEGWIVCNLTQKSPEGRIVGPSRVVLQGTGQWTTDAQNPCQRGDWFTRSKERGDYHPGQKMTTIGFGMLHVGCSLIVLALDSPNRERYELMPTCSELWLGVPPAN